MSIFLESKDVVELVRLPTGARVPDILVELARRHDWSSAVCTGIGGVSDVELAYYDLPRKEYLPIHVPGIVELVALNGNLTLRDGDLFWHMHAVVADQSGRAWGGHLTACTVALTVELAITPLSKVHVRVTDETLGLRLLAQSTND